MGRILPSMKVNNYAAIFTSPIFKNQNGEWYRDVTYTESMELIRENFLGVRKSFVAIGYFLKHLSRNDLYKEGGYESIWECAKAEFGLSQTSATRYMQMNDAYSKNGDTPVLDEKYMEFSKSQLQEMLSLPETVREEVRPEQTVLEIREIAKAEKAKKEPTDEDIQCFYMGWAKKYDSDRNKLKEILLKYFGKSHSGTTGGAIDFVCSPRGIQIGESEEITWTQLVKRINLLFPKDLGEAEVKSCVTNSEDAGYILEGQMHITEYPDLLPDDMVIDAECRETAYPLDSQIRNPDCQEQVCKKDEAYLPDIQDAASQLSEIKEILEQEKNLLKEYFQVGELPEKTVFRQKIIVGALAAMVCELEDEEPENIGYLLDRYLEQS